MPGVASLDHIQVRARLSATGTGRTEPDRHSRQGSSSRNNIDYILLRLATSPDCSARCDVWSKRYTSYQRRWGVQHGRVVGYRDGLRWPERKTHESVKAGREHRKSGARQQNRLPMSAQATDTVDQLRVIMGSHQSFFFLRRLRMGSGNSSSLESPPRPFDRPSGLERMSSGDSGWRDGPAAAMAPIAEGPGVGPSDVVRSRVAGLRERRGDRGPCESSCIRA